MIRVHQQSVLEVLHDFDFFLHSGFLRGTTLGATSLALDLPFVLLGGLLSCFVPLLLSDSIEHFFTPENHMERVNAERRLRAVIRDGIFNPPGAITG